MIGKMISHYKILEKIGGGGMGVVYKAEDTKLKRHVALKFLPPHLTQDAESKERFIHEARAASALQHVNICTIYEIGETVDHQLYIAMEHLEGRTLKDQIRGSQQNLDETIDIVMQIAQGLEKAHKKEIIHRDIKPANIMVTDDGVVKIVDFGLAKLAGQTKLTKTGSTLGTVAYMSPEQARGEDVDHQSDIWSLGVVFYEMLCGRLPFRGDFEQAMIYSIINEEPESIKKQIPDLSQDLVQIVTRVLEKKKDARYTSATEMLTDLQNYRDGLQAAKGAFSFRTLVRTLKKPRIAIPSVAAVLTIGFLAVWFFSRQAKVRWAREVALPEIERMIEADWRDFTEPFKLALDVEKVIPNDPRLAEFLSEISFDNIEVETEPPGAEVYVKLYSEPESEWEYLGVSPLENVRLPIGPFRWKFEKEGYETVLAAATSWNFTTEPKNRFIPNRITRKLDEKESIPEGMIRVPAVTLRIGKLNDFFIDRYEVTNRQFKAFIDAGGYRKKEFWKHPFIKEGRKLTWEKAMAEFVDPSDQPGPSTWLGGAFPQGQDVYPVSGISWYEAAAYAEFVGKSLPTRFHWNIARGSSTKIIQSFQMGGNALFAPFSNFTFESSVPVGSLPGVTAYGAYDMAGNVREWCWNKTQHGRVIRGGSWKDNTYMFGNISNVPTFDRSAQNGFRCVLYPDPEKIPDAAFRLVEMGEEKDYYKEQPVSDTVFKIYREQFSYDKTELNALVESRDDSSADWIMERVTFDAAYGGERMIAVLFLPKHVPPPYQTVLYFPGVQAQRRRSSEALGEELEFKVFLSFVVKNSRAAVYPVYKGTMERRDDALLRSDPNSHRKTEYRVKVVKDFRRCIDYLETREDIDCTKLAYLGMSWGGAWPSLVIPAVEDRLKASVLIAGGFVDLGRPEVRPFNYVTRVKIPTLMINGRYDSSHGLDRGIRPMFDLLGTPDEHKALKLYDTDHIPPRHEFIKETLVWLDRYLGPINRDEIE